MHVTGSGGGPTLPPGGPQGPGNIFHDRVVNHLATLEYSLNGFKNRTTATGEPFNKNGLSGKSVANIKNESFQDILKDAVSREDLLFLSGQLKTYQTSFKKFYSCDSTNRNEYQDHLDFFNQSLSKVSQKIAVTEGRSGNSAAPLPDNISETPSNLNQKNLGTRLRITMLNRGILAIRIPLDPLLKTVLPKRPICSSYKSQPLKASVQFKMRSKMAAFIPDKALRKCLNVPEKKATEKTSTTDEKHSIKSTDTASQADTQDASGMSSSPESPLSGKNNGSGQADDIHKKSETSKTQVLTPAEETAVDVTDTEEQQSQAPKEKELQTHLLNNNPNLMVLLHNQNAAQTRPAVTAEKPKQASPKNPTLEEFLKEKKPLELLIKDSEKNPQSPALKEKKAVIPREQASLSNNNLVVLLYSQNTAHTRPAVTPEKPIENSKQAFLKKLTLEVFLKELKKLLDEVKKLSSGTAEAITVAREKTQDSELLRKLKKLKPAQFIQQQLARKDPCNAEKDIHQRLEKIKALHDSLRRTKLETSDVNEALTWLSNTIEDLTHAEKKAAETCAKFRRTFGTVNS